MFSACVFPGLPPPPSQRGQFVNVAQPKADCVSSILLAHDWFWAYDASESLWGIWCPLTFKGIALLLDVVIWAHDTWSYWSHLGLKRVSWE